MKKLKIPNHVAIILDGNGRWAKERGLTRSLGHKAGFDNMNKLCLHVYEMGSKYLSVYAFSTENFNRPKDEVDYLMNLFVEKFKHEANFFVDNEIRVVFSGRRDNLRDDVLEAIDGLTEMTKNYTEKVLNVCLNYGGRAEIVDTCNKIIKDGILNVSEDLFKKYLYNDLPDIDLCIRTSGEIRLSNFMLWQLSYAELYFPKCYFPSFSESEYDKALLEYTNRDRRFGAIKNE